MNDRKLEKLLNLDILKLDEQLNKQNINLSQILNQVNKKPTCNNYNRFIELLDWFNFYYSVLTLLCSISSEDEKLYLDKHLSMFSNFSKSFRCDKNVIEFLKNVPTIDTNKGTLRNLIIRLQINGAELSENCKRALLKMHNYESNIFEKINKISIPIEKGYLNIDTYHGIIQETKKHLSRIEYDNKLSISCSDIFPVISRLLVYRDTVYKKLDFNNYFEYKTGKNKNDIKYMFSVIKYLVTATNNRVSLLLNKLYSINENTKLCRGDIVYYTPPPDYQLDPTTAYDILLDVLAENFELKIKYIKRIKNFFVYSVSDYGYLYLNLNCYNFQSGEPMFINLGKGIATVVANYDKSIIRYTDIVSLAREVGYALQYICSKSSIQEEDQEFYTLIPKISEWIVKDPNNISRFNASFKNKNVSIVVKSIQRYYHYTEPMSLRFKCINSIFDFYVHSNNKFINELKTINKKRMHLLFNNTYKNIAKKVMYRFSDYIDTNNLNISPHILLQLVNGEQGVVFGSIITDVFAYNIYISLRRKKQEFKDIILTNNVSMRERIEEYIQVCKMDSNKFINNYRNRLGDDNKSSPSNDGISVDNDDTVTEEAFIV